MRRPPGARRRESVSRSTSVSARRASALRASPRVRASSASLVSDWWHAAASAAASRAHSTAIPSASRKTRTDRSWRTACSCRRCPAPASTASTALAQIGRNADAVSRPALGSTRSSTSRASESVSGIVASASTRTRVRSTSPAASAPNVPASRVHTVCARPIRSVAATRDSRRAGPISAAASSIGSSNPACAAPGSIHPEARRASSSMVTSWRAWAARIRRSSASNWSRSWSSVTVRHSNMCSMLVEGSDKIAMSAFL